MAEMMIGRVWVYQRQDDERKPLYVIDLGKGGEVLGSKGPYYGTDGLVEEWGKPLTVGDSLRRAWLKRWFTLGVLAPANERSMKRIMERAMAREMDEEEGVGQ